VEDNYTVLFKILRHHLSEETEKPENWSIVIFLLLDKNRKREFLNMKEY